MLPYFNVRISFQFFYIFYKFQSILRTDLPWERKVPETVEGAKSHKTNTSEKKFCTSIMRNSVIHFTLKSSLPHPLLENHSTVHIFLPSVPFSRIILQLEISFLQLAGHSRSREATHRDSPESVRLNSQLPQFLLQLYRAHDRCPFFSVGRSNFSTG